MKIKQHTITTLYASEGMMLTNGSDYVKIISLGGLDSPENWHEITMEEYTAILDAEAEES